MAAKIVLASVLLMVALAPAMEISRDGAVRQPDVAPLRNGFTQDIQERLLKKDPVKFSDLSNGLRSMEVECSEEPTSIIVEAGETVVFTSPRYPKKYKKNTNCRWILYGGPATRFNVTCDDFKLPKPNKKTGVCTDYLALEDEHFCGDMAKDQHPQGWLSYDMYHDFWFSFVSDNKKQTKGFRCEATAYIREGLVNNMTTIPPWFTTPYWNGTYFTTGVWPAWNGTDFPWYGTDYDYFTNWHENTDEDYWNGNFSGSTNWPWFGNGTDFPDYFTLPPFVTGNGSFPWPVPTGNGSFPWPLPTGNGSFPWPLPTGNGSFPWPLPTGNGSFPWPLPTGDGSFTFPPYVTGNGSFPWPLPTGSGSFTFPPIPGNVSFSGFP